MTAQPSSVNPWRYIFTIPIDATETCESSMNESSRIELKTINNTSIECSGLRWRLYLYQERKCWRQQPMQQRFALSVIPINDNRDNILPENYTMSYIVHITLLSRRADELSEEEAKSAPPNEHQWTRSYEDTDSLHSITEQ